MRRSFSPGTPTRGRAIVPTLKPDSPFVKKMREIRRKSKERRQSLPEELGTTTENHSVDSKRELHGKEGKIQSSDDSLLKEFTVQSRLNLMEAYDGTDIIEVEDWLKQFEGIVRDSPWSDRVKVVNLGTKLKGIAKTWFLRLKDSEMEKFDAVKKSLVEAFRNDEKKYGLRADFKQIKQKKGERVQEYTQRYLYLEEKIGENVLLERYRVHDFNETLQEPYRSELLKKKHKSWDLNYKKLVEMASEKKRMDETVDDDLRKKIRKLERELKEQKAGINGVDVKQTSNGASRTDSNQNRSNFNRSSNDYRRSNFNSRLRGNSNRSGRYQNTSFRTTDGRPICRRCGKVGHVAYQCEAPTTLHPIKNPADTKIDTTTVSANVETTDKVSQG
jgi:hypothetical protein